VFSLSYIRRGVRVMFSKHLKNIKMNNPSFDLYKKDLIYIYKSLYMSIENKKENNSPRAKRDDYIQETVKIQSTINTYNNQKR
jgi:hypothetical protein